MAFWVARYLNEAPEAKLIAVSDPRPDKLKEFAERFKADVHYDYYELLRRDDIDIAVILAPPAKIPQYMIASAEAGKHIFISKPMAMSLKEADQALTSVKKSGVKLVAFESFVKLMKKPPIDAIGNVLAITTILHQGIAEDWYHSGTPGWFADPKQVPGGAFIDEGIYQIEAHRFYAGSEVKRVNYARMENLVFKSLAVEDFGQANLTFENGIISSLEIGWTITQPEPKNKGSLAKANAYHCTTIIGSEGEIISGGLHSPDEAVLSKASPYWVFNRPMPETAANPSFPVLEHLIECIEKDEKPEASGEDARKSLEIALAVYRSAKTNSAVLLPFK